MRFPFLLKWFLIGFTLRLLFAVFVVLRAWFYDREATLMYFMDVPTLAVAHVLERISPKIAHAFGGGWPIYQSWNLTGCLVWGLIFMSVGWLFVLIVKPTLRLR